MNEDLIKELDNDSLMELLNELENLDEVCALKLSKMVGDSNE